jgi:hypothetical protein
VIFLRCQFFTETHGDVMATTWKNSLRTTLGSKSRVFEKIVRNDESGKKVTAYSLVRRGQEQDAATAATGGAAAASHHASAASTRVEGIAASTTSLPLHHEGIGALSVSPFHVTCSQ